MIVRPSFSENRRKWYGVDSGQPGTVRFGVGTHAFIQGAGSGDANAAIAIALGSKINRDELTWAAIEQVEQVYRWTGQSTGITEYMSMVDDLAIAGCTSLAILGFNNTIYQTGLTSTPEALAAFADYVTHVVTNTIGKVEIYEVFNEWNFGFANTDIDPNLYMAVLQVAYAAAKAANPNVQILAPVALDPYHPDSAAWTTEFLALDWPDYCDGFSFHQYASPTGTQMHPPERSYELMQAFCQRVRKIVPGIAIYMTESGYFNGSSTGFISEAATKAYLSRYPFLLRACPFTGVALYEARNTGTGTAATRGENYGLYTHLGVAKAQAAAVTAAFTHVHAATTAIYFDDTSGTTGNHAVRMTVAGGERLAIWNLDGGATVNVSVPAAGAGTLSVETIGGAVPTQGLASGANTISVTLTDTAKVLFADVAISFPEFA